LKSKLLTRGAVAVVVFGLLCALAACLAPSGQRDPKEAMWYSVVPPLLAIVLAFLTRRVLPSLGIAILVGGVLTQVPQAPLSAAAWLEGFKTAGMHLVATVTDKSSRGSLCGS